MFDYHLVVEWTGDECTAFLDERDSPFRGYGSTPTQAIASLLQVVLDWPKGGAERWLGTPSGTKLARMFVPGFEPTKSSGGEA